MVKFQCIYLYYSGKILNSIVLWLFSCFYIDNLTVTVLDIILLFCKGRYQTAVKKVKIDFEAHVNRLDRIQVVVT